METPLSSAAGPSDGVDCCRTEPLPGLSPAPARDLAEVFAALADPSRLRLVDLLARAAGRVCVCELVEAVGLAQPTVSHHLRVLRTAGLVDFEKRSVWAYYFLRPGALQAVGAAIQAWSGMAEEEAGRVEAGALEAVPGGRRR